MKNEYRWLCWIGSVSVVLYTSAKSPCSLHRGVRVRPKSSPLELAESMFSTRVLQQAMCAWPLPPHPSWSEHHSRHLWILHVANTQPVIRVPLSPVNTVILYSTHQLQFCHPFHSICYPQADIHSGCIDRQERNTDVPVVFVYNKTKLPWGGTRYKTRDMSQAGIAALLWLQYLQYLLSVKQIWGLNDSWMSIYCYITASRRCLVQISSVKVTWRQPSQV